MIYGIDCALGNHCVSDVIRRRQTEISVISVGMKTENGMDIYDSTQNSIEFFSEIRLSYTHTLTRTDHKYLVMCRRWN